MGKVTGLLADVSGKIGGYVVKKQPDGTSNISQLQRPSSKPFTKKQLAVQQRTLICSTMLATIDSFIRIGFALDAAKSKMNYYNAAAVNLRKNALSGEYPEISLDYSKLLVTKGKLNSPEDPTVTLDEFGIIFSWSTEQRTREDHFSDQVMMLAYFPEINKARYTISGAERRKGKDMLVLSGIEQGYTAELFISFIANDHRAISNSVYLGQMIW